MGALRAEALEEAINASAEAVVAGNFAEAEVVARWAIGYSTIHPELLEERADAPAGVRFRAHFAQFAPRCRITSGSDGIAELTGAGPHRLHSERDGPRGNGADATGPVLSVRAQELGLRGRYPCS